MTRPDSIKVGAIVYTVEWHGEDWLDRYDRRGDCCPRKATIGVCEAMPPAQQAVTLLHEVCHAIEHASATCGEKLEPEQAALLYSGGLAMVWRDNPGLVRWLIDSLGVVHG